MSVETREAIYAAIERNSGYTANSSWLTAPNPNAGKRHYEVRDGRGVTIIKARDIVVWANAERCSRKSMAIRECDDLAQHCNMLDCTVVMLPAQAAS